jgi:hypothetical protein
MGCNCGKKKERKAPEAKTGQTQSFRLELPDGQTFSFSSLLEARAAQVRWGRRGTITTMK